MINVSQESNNGYTPLNSVYIIWHMLKKCQLLLWISAGDLFISRNLLVKLDYKIQNIILSVTKYYPCFTNSKMSPQSEYYYMANSGVRVLKTASKRKNNF